MTEITIIQAPVEIQLILLGIILIAGIALQVGLGYLRNRQQYGEKRNNGKILVTVIISGFADYFLVGPHLGSINWVLSIQISIITVVLTLIATVAGIDTVTKKIGNIGKSKGEKAGAINDKIKDLTVIKENLSK